MKKNNALIKDIDKMSGNVLCIGDIDNKIVKKLDENKSITTLNILGNTDYNSEDIIGKVKKLRIKNLRKFKHKKINYLICDYDKIDEYLNTFIKDSIYITKDYIYFCSNNKKIEKLYNRYDVSIKSINCDDKDIFIINTKRAKNNIFKEFIYQIIDFINSIIDIITNLIVN